MRSIRYVLACATVLMAAPCAAQTPSPFESAPGPASPAPRPRAVRPAPAPEPVAPSPSVVVPAGIAAFNGAYRGGAAPDPVCRATEEQWNVSDGKVIGVGTDGVNTWTVSGTVSGDGTMNGLNGQQPLTGRFQNGTFEGSYPSRNPQCRPRILSLRRDTR